MSRTYIFQALVLTVLMFQSVAAASAEEKLVSYKMMSLDLALTAAKAAMQSCRDQGYQVTVAVIEKGGATQIVLRDDLAGIFTPEIAVRKARTALTFQTDTSNLVEPTRSGTPASGLRHSSEGMFVGGGVRVGAGGLIVGAIGISGAPSPDIDEACAKTGIEAISDILDF